MNMFVDFSVRIKILILTSSYDMYIILWEKLWDLSEADLTLTLAGVIPREMESRKRLMAWVQMMFSPIVKLWGNHLGARMRSPPSRRVNRQTTLYCNIAATMQLLLYHYNQICVKSPKNDGIFNLTPSDLLGIWFLRWFCVKKMSSIRPAV